MERLLILRDSDVIRGAADAGPLTFSHRWAARAIVTSEAGQVALLKVGKYNYHKLPGGGVEPGEGMEQALERELLEEIGCQAELAMEVGEIIEYRSREQQKQTSHCYLAEQFGYIRPPAFTAEELSEGFQVVWAANIKEAIQLLKHDKPASYAGQFIQKRDLAFLERAKNQL